MLTLQSRDSGLTQVDPIMIIIIFILMCFGSTQVDHPKP
jgi:hypothetical protein